MTFVNERTEEGKLQTIDHERDVVLRKISGPNIEGYYECELVLEDQVVKFSAYSNDKVHGKPRLGEESLYDMNWQIFKIFIPQTIQNRKAEILKLIEESLKAWGWDYSQKKVNSVSVQFDTEIR